jgi:hypothetical protein
MYQMIMQTAISCVQIFVQEIWVVLVIDVFEQNSCLKFKCNDLTNKGSCVSGSSTSAFLCPVMNMAGTQRVDHVHLLSQALRVFQRNFKFILSNLLHS